MGINFFSKSNDNLTDEEISKNCIFDIGYNENTKYRGIDCDHPNKPITKNCKYNNSSTSQQSFDVSDENELNESKLDCSYKKWKWDDPNADTSEINYNLQNKRKKKMLLNIQKVCRKNNVYCSEKTLSGKDKQRDNRCVEVKACDDIPPSIDGMIDDIRGYVKEIMELFKIENKYKTKKLSKKEKSEKKEQKLSKIKEKKGKVAEWYKNRKSKQKEKKEAKKEAKSEKSKKKAEERYKKAMAQGEATRKWQIEQRAKQKERIEQYKRGERKSFTLDPGEMYY